MIQKEKYVNEKNVPVQNGTKRIILRPGCTGRLLPGGCVGGFVAHTPKWDAMWDAQVLFPWHIAAMK